MYIMADDKYTERPSMSDIFKNLLSCSDEQSILEKTIHVYDPKELQTGWQTTKCNVKYIACPTGTERRGVVASPSTVKSESSKKRTKKLKAKEEHENSYKYDKCKSLGVLSYDVPSWRTIIDPETCTYIQRPHPCLCFTATAGVGDLKRLTFIDPAGVLDQHLGGFVQRQQARNEFQTGFGRLNNVPFIQNDSNVETNVKHYNRLQMPLNHLKSPLEEKSEFRPDNLVTTSAPKILKPLPVTSWKGNLQTSSITLTTKNLPSNKCSTIDRKTGRIHRDILHSQKIKLAPFRPPFIPVVQPNRKQKQKLNWLPITTTSPCLSRNTGQSEVGKPAWSKMVVVSHDPIN